MSGFAPIWMPDFLFGFQSFLVDWSLRKGAGALLTDCGTGKTAMELVWGENIVRKTNKSVLLVTPLAVSRQTVKEAEKFGVEAIRNQTGAIPAGARLIVTNYERLHLFDPSQFSALICDESSAIKNFDGKRKEIVTEFMKKLPYRLLCTATAAPNDYVELGTSSEALGELGHIDMLNKFFKNDQNTSDTKLLHRRTISQGGQQSAGWRFKGHAEQAFWRWVCSWARAMRKPSDLGFSDEGFHLPPLIENEHIVETKTFAPGMLFALPSTNMREEREERRRTIQERCEKASDLVYMTGNPAVVWCHLNDEGDLLERLIPGGRQIAGSTPDEEKEELYDAFGSGQLKDLIIKDKIGAWGLNWQHCNHVVRFATHSYESHYQAVRRCWRFGQTRPVTVDLVVTEGEIGVKENLQRKSANADRMFSNLVMHMNNAVKIDKDQFFPEKAQVPSWL
tara:strand:+ start:4267 stop:5616 length:1350 start_codon:yes stop_codon:yes gene_type:complete